MIDNCYREALALQDKQYSCNLVERDAVRLLWLEYDFHSLIAYHEVKYMF